MRLSGEPAKLPACDSLNFSMKQFPTTGKTALALALRLRKIAQVAREKANKMNRLRRFYEKMPYGIKSSRVAYVIDAAALPEALPDAEWKEDLSFRAAESVLGDPGLKPVWLRRCDAADGET